MKPPTISVNIRDPLVRGAFNYYERVTPESYTHTISAFGGYDTATIALSMNQDQAEDWLEYGLMRDVKVYGPALTPIWDGFVDEIRINMGPLTVSYGPVTSIANQVLSIFSPLQEGDNYSASGALWYTAAIDDTVSQERFGIMPVYLNAGTQTLYMAEYLRDVYLIGNRSMTVDAWGGKGRYAFIDSITLPKYELRVLSLLRDTGSFTGLVDVVGNRPAKLKENQTQRLWFLAERVYDGGAERSADFEISHSVQVYRQAKYLSMRGNR